MNTFVAKRLRNLRFLMFCGLINSAQFNGSEMVMNKLSAFAKRRHSLIYRATGAVVMNFFGG